MRLVPHTSYMLLLVPVHSTSALHTTCHYTLFYVHMSKTHEYGVFGFNE